MSEAIFKLDHLRHYQVINGPCSAIVRVGADVRYLTADNNPRYLVNLNVILKESVDKIINRIGSQEQVNFNFVKDLFISGAIFKDKISSIEELPIKGERVIATFDYIENVMRCTHISTLPREQLKFVDLERLNKTQKLFAEIIKLKEND